MSAILMTKQTSLNDVPIPNNGDAVLFIDSDGVLKTRDHTGAVSLYGRFTELNSYSLHTSRAGVVAGAVVQSVVNAGNLLGRIVKVDGFVTLVSTVANATNNLVVKVGGMTFTFPAFSVTVSTQQLIYSAVLNVDSTNTAAKSFAVLHMSTQTLATTVGAGDSSQVGSGSCDNGQIDVILKTATTTSLTNRYGCIEVI